MAAGMVYVQDGKVVVDAALPTPDWWFAGEEAVKDYSFSCSSAFQAFLHGDFGENGLGGPLPDAIGTNYDCNSEQAAALRGPVDVLAVASALAFMQEFYNQFGNYDLTGTDPEDFYRKGALVYEEVSKKPIPSWACGLASWAGGWGGEVETLKLNIIGIATWISCKVFDALDVNLTKYLQPEKLNWQGSDGTITNIEQACVNLKGVSPWVHVWLTNKVGVKARKKYVVDEANKEQQQEKVIRNVSEAADTVGNTLGGIVSALGKLMSAAVTILDWIVPILFIGGGVWLLTMIGPPIAKAIRESRGSKEETEGGEGRKKKKKTR